MAMPDLALVSSDQQFRAQLREVLDYLDAAASGVTDGDKGDVVVSGGGTVWTLDPAALPGADLSYTAATRVLASSTGADATLPLFATASTDAGLVPGSETGGTANFLRADGTWAAPAGSAAYSYGVLAADYTLASSVTSQKLFNWSANGALTLATGVYAFECGLYLLGMSATSGNGSFRLRGAGTATLARVLQTALGADDTDPGTPAAASVATVDTQAFNTNTLVAATDTGLSALIVGSFDVTAGGTIIPSIALTNAAAAAVKAGSWFRCLRIGDTGTATAGSWS